ncbi:MAG TPA: ABC transporter permease [Symbiobacteriaceae bacterium]|nr:ABC transporter permease [Symbiobacteriaceae bacterium]
MSEYLIRRLLQSILVLFLISLVSFGLIHAAPGGPTTMLIKPNQSPEIVKIQLHNMGLDRPLHIQYWSWLTRMLKGDFGTTFKAGRPVGDFVWPALKNSLILMTTAWVLQMLIAIPWGIYNSTRQYGFSDNTAAVIGYAGMAMPTFWFAILMQELFSLKLNWLPLSNMYSMNKIGQFSDLVLHMILPVSVLVIIGLASYTRYARASMLEVLGQDYVRTARAKGVSEGKVVFKHALRNALIPIVTILGLDLPGVVAGAALTETVFNWPGMGRLFVDMAFAREYTVIMAVVMIVAVVVIIGNLIADILYALVDPRVRLTGKGAASA